jgi:hypothetical protein
MIKTYKFGLQAPTFNAHLLRDQLKRGHVYQNKLIEIERWRRNELRQVESKAGNIPVLENKLILAQDAFEQIEKKIKANNSKLGFSLVKDGKRPEKAILSEEDKSIRELARKAKKVAFTELKNARKVLRDDPLLKSERDRIHADELKLISEATRADTAPWVGTYQLIRPAVGKTRGMPLYDGANHKDPKFKYFDGGGRIGIGFFNPHEPIEKIVGKSPTSTQLQILPMPPPSPRKNGQLRKVGDKDLRLFRIRIGTAENKRSPIWAEFPMVYHRHIPATSTISLVQVSCRKVGPREKWSVSITFDDNQQIIEVNEKSVVGIDLGWRTMSNGLRVAKWQGSDGVTGEVVLPNDVLAALSKYKEIKEIRDKEFNKIRLILSNWIVDQMFLPEWLKTETETIDKWRSQARLVKLIRRWQAERFAGDEAVMGLAGRWDKQNKRVIEGSGLLGWRYHDHHLWEWETSQRTKSIGHRNELYRIVAATLANQYDAIVFEDIRLNNMAKGKVAGSNRFLSSPSDLRNACKNAARTYGKKYDEVVAAGTSKLHATKTDGSVCGYFNDLGPRLEYSCEGCGEELDRDENAAKNILNRYLTRDKGCMNSTNIVQDQTLAKAVDGLTTSHEWLDEAVLENTAVNA